MFARTRFEKAKKKHGAPRISCGARRVIERKRESAKTKSHIELGEEIELCYMLLV